MKGTKKPHIPMAELHIVAIAALTPISKRPRMNPGHLYIGVPLAGLSHNWHKLEAPFKCEETVNGELQVDIDLDGLYVEEEDNGLQEA